MLDTMDMNITSEVDTPEQTQLCYLRFLEQMAEEVGWHQTIEFMIWNNALAGLDD